MEAESPCRAACARCAVRVVHGADLVLTNERGLHLRMLEIRAASAEDEPRLHAIHHRATMSSYGRELRWLDSILADPATPLEIVEWTIVAVDGASVLGYAAVTGCHLENLFIDPAAQGRGVGGRRSEEH